MGYVHDVNMSAFVHPSDCHYQNGTWSVDLTADVWGYLRTAADAVFNIIIPIKLWGNSVAYRGCKLTSIDIYWDVSTAAMDAVAAAIIQEVLPANGAAFVAPTSLAFSYDAGHDTAGERLTLDQHTMKLTLTTPLWIDQDDVVYAKLYGDAALTSVFLFYGVRLNFTLRV